MAPGEATAFEYDWRYRARPEQLPPAGSWRVWLLMAGRGFGKTRCGAEWVRAEVRQGVVGSPWWGRLRPTRAMSWWRANPAFWPFCPLRSARFTSPASAG